MRSEYVRQRLEPASGPNIEDNRSVEIAEIKSRSTLLTEW
jgi:hypothetical protein